MKWIETSDRLPREGQRVLCQLTKMIWDDEFGKPKIVIASICKGLSKKDRQARIDGKKKDTVKRYWSASTGWVPYERSKMFSSEDEEGNNHKPYNWNGDGMRHFGQEIQRWKPLPK